MNDNITKPAIREIIDDYAKDIERNKQRGAKPSKEVIYFRNWAVNNEEQEVWEVPTEFLRFRKENGRIKSDVLSYEKNHGTLSEVSEDAQHVIRKFLQEKDPEKNKELVNSIKHTGQRNAAIITTDGFLINGNRRKMALERLLEETEDEKYRWMKVVILPGKGDPRGAPPTRKEIQQIENRYQLQSLGISEYYKFDKAITMRDNARVGMSLKEQLKDDPNYANLSEKELNREVKKHEEEYIAPLNCIERYLSELGREGLYETISTGISDREGRWQAFLDYSKHVRKKLDDAYQREKIGVDEDETGEIEEIAFKIIRKRDFPNMPKVHKIMRDLPKWVAYPEAKKELKKLLDIDLSLPEDECFGEDGNEYDERKKDNLWGAKYASTLIKHVKNAQRIVEHEKEKETPITLMEAAIKKLEHDNMDLTTIDIFKHYKEVREKLVKIQNLAGDLESEWYELKKNVNKPKNKFGKA
ncbi:MAG: hypothetical protein MI921_09590 [Cytophagales bacterium]|nr:hypothetical protein [Cytophagales bacterium]